MVDLRLDLVTALLGAQVDLLVGGDSTVFSGESEMLTISWSTSWSVDNSFFGSCLLGGSLFTLATGFPDCRSLGAAIFLFRDRTAFLLYSPTNLNGAPGVALVRSPVKHTIQSQGERDMKQLLKPFAETVIVEPPASSFPTVVTGLGPLPAVMATKEPSA